MDMRRVGDRQRETYIHTDRQRQREIENDDNTNDSCLEPVLSSGGGSFFHAYKDHTL